MKKSEKIVAAIVTLTLGVLLIVLKGDMLQVFTSVFGILLIILAIFDFVKQEMKIALAKFAIGLLILIFGWLIVKAVIYVLAALLVIVAVWGIYDLIKCGVGFALKGLSLLLYARPIVCALIGILLFFNEGGEAEWVFVICGIFTVVEGGLFLAEALINE